jgi:hypothetical protein
VSPYFSQYLSLHRKQKQLAELKQEQSRQRAAAITKTELPQSPEGQGSKPTPTKETEIAGRDAMHDIFSDVYNIYSARKEETNVAASMPFLDVWKKSSMPKHDKTRVDIWNTTYGQLMRNLFGNATHSEEWERMYAMVLRSVGAEELRLDGEEYEDNSAPFSRRRVTHTGKSDSSLLGKS